MNVSWRVWINHDYQECAHLLMVQCIASLVFAMIIHRIAASTRWSRINGLAKELRGIDSVIIEKRRFDMTVYHTRVNER